MSRTNTQSATDDAQTSTTTGSAAGAAPVPEHLTVHYEPAEVGGAMYFRCEDCGAECLSRDMVHRPECDH